MDNRKTTSILKSALTDYFLCLSLLILLPHKRITKDFACLILWRHIFPLCWNRSRQPVSYPVFLLSMVKQSCVTSCVGRILHNENHIMQLFPPRQFEQSGPGKQGANPLRDELVESELTDVSWKTVLSIDCLENQKEKFSYLTSVCTDSL